MKFLFSCVALLAVMSSNVFAQTAQVLVPQQNSEYVAAQAFLSSRRPEDRLFVKFFSFASIPAASITVEVAQVEMTYKQATEHALNFWIHSLSNRSIIQKLRPVPNTDLFFVDIRDYGWTLSAWEIVASQNPYYQPPWVDNKFFSVTGPLLTDNDIVAYSAQNPDYMGYAIVRADWFLVYTSDTTKQFDYDREPLYYTLLYANSKPPDTVEEFRTAWAVNEEELKLYEVIRGAIVDFGHSGVARQARQLARARTIIGYYHETSDFKNMEGPRDPTENIDDNTLGHKARDAGEAIATNKIGLQVYMLLDGQGKRVEFADPTVAWDRTQRQDIRVKTARSCIVCHADGLNPAGDSFFKWFNEGNVELKVYDKDYAIQLQQFYTTEFGQLIQDDNLIFQRALQRVNGLEPAVNAYVYRQLIEKYEASLTLEDMARECGIDVATLQQRLSVTVRGRLAASLNGIPMPREVWDNIKVNVFGEAMVVLYNLSIPKEIDEKNLTILRNTDLTDSEDKVLAQLKKDEKVVFIARSKEGTWTQVKYKDLEGWVSSDDVSPTFK